MKHCIAVLDGICDYPHMRIQNRTPLEVARTPHLDGMVSKGRMGIVKNIPEELPAESIIGMMSIMGLNPHLYYTGRAAFEALAAEIPISANDWVFSCDLISTFEGTMADPRAGLVRTAEAQVLLDELNQKLSHKNVHFHLCSGYHHLMVIKDNVMSDVITHDPISFTGELLEDYYPEGEGSGILIRIMQEAYQILHNHEINKIRRELQENPADAIWLWGGGQISQIPAFQEIFQRKGGLISAYPEIKGLGKSCQLEILDVPKITGSWDTNLAGKAEYAIKALQYLDIVFVHIGAPVAVSKYGQISQKVRILERIDDQVIKPLKENLGAEGRITVVGGHFISVNDKVGADNPVPFVTWGKGIKCSSNHTFSEKNAKQVNLSISPGQELLKFLFDL